MYANPLLSARPLSLGHLAADYRAADYLRQEIAFFESRLGEMGEQGDCAYERALSRAYALLLDQRRQQLAQLPAESVEKNHFYCRIDQCADAARRPRRVAAGPISGSL